MKRKDRIDAFGAASLIGFSALLGFNQVIVKIVNAGLQPVFFAGLRSAGAILCLWLIFRLRGRSLAFPRGMWGLGVVIGLAFAAEFILLFLALDLTTVTRTSVIFYSMPVWLALGAHLFLPGERMTPLKALGLLVAFAGVVWAIVGRGAGGGQGSLAGDLCSLAAAMAWAGIALLARGTRLREVRPDMQLFVQVLVSAPVLLIVAPLFGPLVRELEPVHLWWLLFQIVAVVSLGFSFWLWLLSIYPAGGVASFSFLAPIFGVGFGWLILDEAVGATILGALVLVAAGILLINRPAKRDQVPQKV